MPRWFRKKTFGYGWTPCTWQGWLVTAAFTAGVMAAALDTRDLGPARTLEIIAGLTIILFAVTAFTSGRDSDA